MDCKDGALQILLIVDYIFDWARDLYRPGIRFQLELLSGNDASDARSLYADTEIPSLNDPDDRLPQWQHGVELQSNLDPCNPTPDDFIQDESPKIQVWRHFDSENGTFRLAQISENSFQCLYVTGDSIRTVLEWTSLRKSTNAIEKFARATWHALNKEPLLMSESSLTLLEDKWTGKKRISRQGAKVGDNIFVAITYHTLFTEEWKQINVITCLAFDESALTVVKQEAHFKFRKLEEERKFRDAVHLSEKDVETLVQSLQRSPAEDNFIAAIKRSNSVLTKWRDQAANLAFVPAKSRSIHDLVSQVYRTHSNGLQQPNDPYIRFSSQTQQRMFLKSEMSSLRIAPSRQPVNLIEPDVSLEGTMIGDGSVLVYSEYESSRVPRCCVFITAHVGTPPRSRDRLATIANILRSDNYFQTGSCSSEPGPSNTLNRTDIQRQFSNSDHVRRTVKRWYQILLRGHKIDQGEIFYRDQLPRYDPYHGISFEDIEERPSRPYAHVPSPQARKKDEQGDTIMGDSGMLVSTGTSQSDDDYSDNRGEVRFAITGNGDMGEHLRYTLPNRDKDGNVIPGKADSERRRRREEEDRKERERLESFWRQYPQFRPL